jgi:hypothetical protein
MHGVGHRQSPNTFGSSDAGNVQVSGVLNRGATISNQLSCFGRSRVTNHASKNFSTGAAASAARNPDRKITEQTTGFVNRTSQKSNVHKMPKFDS